MKCDGLPDPACVKQLNTYLTLWREDGKESINSVLQTTLDVLPIMASLESIIENPGMTFVVYNSELYMYLNSTNGSRYVSQCCDDLFFKHSFQNTGRRRLSMRYSLVATGP